MESDIILILFPLFYFSSFCSAAAPTINGLPTSISLGELETTNRVIYSISASDTDGDSFVCEVSATTPVSAPFIVNKNPTNNVYQVWTNSPTFDYATTASYAVDITCTDSNTDSSTETLTVDIIDNDELKFLSTPYTVTKDASTTLINQAIFTPTATDALGHAPLYYTMSTSPASTSFKIDSGSGQILAAQDLKYEVNTPINIDITVTDGNIEVTETLVVSLTNMNNVPKFTNLPASIDVLESIASGKTLFSLTPYDADVGSSLTYTMTVSPVAHSAYFSYNTNTQKVLLSSGYNFNYETNNFYNLSFTISDGLATGGPFFLAINIKNVDEACYFDKTLYHVSTTEGAAGSISLSPGFVVSDHDGFSSATYSWLNANNSDRFTINSGSGDIGFAVNYNVDNSAMPSNVILTVVCTDPTGVTGTAKVEITISDINDNAPTFGLPNYILYADQYDTAGNAIGTLVPTDADSGTNAQYTCSGSTISAIGPTYYNIGTDCGVYLVASPAGILSYGTVVQYTVTATDTGGLSDTAVVDIIYREATTTTTTTTQAPDTSSIWNDSAFLAVFCLAVTFGAIMAAILLYSCLRCCVTGSCCGPEPFDFCNCCRSRPYKKQRRIVTPETPKLKRSRLRNNDQYFREDERVERISRVSNGARSYKDFPLSVNSPAIGYY